ncbi:hypothetical protein AGMMS50267_15710 [Spirochaetia bacterium]|nr:hypothetical protein AGMMS50267_15710 [Spirochaetia bacterium]
MGEAVKVINAFLQNYSGIITSLLVILVFIGSLSKRFKNWIFRDIYFRLDKMENNDLRHIDLSLQRSRKIEDLTLDILTGVIPKGDVPNSRAQIETWYAREIEKLLKAQSKSK